MIGVQSKTSNNLNASILRLLRLPDLQGPQ